MSESTDPIAPERFPSGIEGLDLVLGGGLFHAGIYVVAGQPGAGKTILANQAAFHCVGRGGRVAYVTLLSETHGRMISTLRSMSFFDEKAVGAGLIYVNGFAAVEQDGLAGLLQLLRRVVRDQRADLLILDGMVTVGTLAPSGIDYKKFIHELQTWVGMVGTTVLFLTSGAPDSATQPEHSMVDGIFELHAQRFGLRVVRELFVSKFRGAAQMEGGHPYVIRNHGITVYPRFELRYGRAMPATDRLRGERVPTGIDGLDELLTGGLPRASSTLVLGSSGAGKMIWGYQFVASGATRGEPGLIFSFYEDPLSAITKAERLGMPLRALTERGMVHTAWEPPAETLLDALGERILELVREKKVRRLFLDGLAGFKEAAFRERLSVFLATLMHELGALDVTTVVTEETRELYVSEIEVPTIGVSAIFHNILFVHQVELRGELRRLMCIMKTRDAHHARALHHFTISDAGIRMGERAAVEDHVLSGPRVWASRRTSAPKKVKVRRTKQ